MYTISKPQTSFLDAVLNPAELKKLSPEQLQLLAQEIRSEVINNLSQTGGHLSSNLGIVEITLGLHRVFTTPEDVILWDVGHQCYVHKMLTGRRHQFKSLRQHKGLSGFINPNESEHDAFVAGHSSTSISLAVGMAIARDHLKKDNKVIAVIGDGGLTGGMALEAINHLGHIQRNVVIILNDNEMSISPNLGGFSQYMKRIKETFFYQDIKKKIDQIEDRLDRAHLNEAVWELISSVKKQAKERFDTPGIVFEKLGINYSGPIDGHDVGAVINALEKTKTQNCPQIIHIITQKGRGYEPAEKDSIKYHGVSAGSMEPTLTEKVEPGVQASKPKPKTYSEVFSQALIEIAELEPNMVAITPATAEGSGLVKFGNVYPERFFDVAICEQHAVTMAAGMAKAGLKPVVSIYSTFLQRALDQVIHDVAIMNLPVVFGIDRAGLVEDGETHQGVFDIAHLRSVPNLRVLAPKNAKELRDMLYTVLRENSGPTAIRFPRDKAVDATDNMPLEVIDWRSWEVLEESIQSQSGDGTKSGSTVSILAYGSMVEAARQAAPALKKLGVNFRLVNARSAKPLDAKMLGELLARKNERIVTIEEAQLSGGFGAAVLEFAARQAIATGNFDQAKIACLGIPDNFVEHGARNILLSKSGIGVDEIVETIRKFSGA